MNHYLEEFIIDSTRDLNKEQVIERAKHFWLSQSENETWDSWEIGLYRYCVTCLSK